MLCLAKEFDQVDIEESFAWKDKVVLGYWTVFRPVSGGINY